MIIGQLGDIWAPRIHTRQIFSCGELQFQDSTGGPYPLSELVNDPLTYTGWVLEKTTTEIYDDDYVKFRWEANAGPYEQPQLYLKAGVTPGGAPPDYWVPSIRFMQYNAFNHNIDLKGGLLNETTWYYFTNNGAHDATFDATSGGCIFQCSFRYGNWSGTHQNHTIPNYELYFSLGDTGNTRNVAWKVEVIEKP